ncbi:MAG: TrkH family potassium uptake protein [Thermoplasmatota archaeon]
MRKELMGVKKRHPGKKGPTSGGKGEAGHDGDGDPNMKRRPVMRTLRDSNPVMLVIYGYIAYIVVGSLLLIVPFSQAEPVPFLDNVFVSTSAVSTTGLSPVNISEDYNVFGQGVILFLIQIGGIGYMTFSSFILLSSRKDLTDERKKVSKTVFSIPKDFLIEKFLVRVVLFTAAIETLGALALYFIFRSEGVKAPLWQAVFTSISAFCTAGFSLLNGNLEQFTGNFWLNLVVSILSISGAIGFIVFVDIFNKITGKTECLSFTTRVILRTTFWILLIGTFIVLISEGSFSDLTSGQKIMAAFFQTMTSMTTVGFNTVPIAPMAKSVLFLTVILMIIGASPAGTGGGVKSTTLVAVIGQIRSVLFSKRDVKYWGQKVPNDRVKQANATFAMYLAALFLGVYLLALTEKASLMEILFEATSALGTVGLSMGFTSQLTILGKIIVILLMFVGRVGPLTFGMAIFVKSKLIWDDSRTDLAI